jgi:hypothetical protein
VAGDWKLSKGLPSIETVARAVALDPPEDVDPAVGLRRGELGDTGTPTYSEYSFLRLASVTPSHVLAIMSASPAARGAPGNRLSAFIGYAGPGIEHIAADPAFRARELRRNRLLGAVDGDDHRRTA